MSQQNEMVNTNGPELLKSFVRVQLDFHRGRYSESAIKDAKAKVNAGCYTWADWIVANSETE